MDETEFDRRLVAAAFDAIAARGWRRFSVAIAARSADLPLEQARLRFPRKTSVLIRFGRFADAAALAALSAEGAQAGGSDGMAVRDRLFEMMMRRFDVLQAHRAGVIALLRHLPTDPPLAAMLGCASLSSMGWLLEAAEISASGPLGRLRRKGLLGVWLWAVRAWMRDESVDLPGTMAALDTALSRAEQAASWLPGGSQGGPHGAPPESPLAEPPSEPPPEPSPKPPGPSPEAAPLI